MTGTMVSYRVLPIFDPQSRSFLFVFDLNLGGVRRVRRTDIRDGRGDADLNTRVTLLSELASEELVQLGVEDTIGDELATLGDSLGLSGAVSTTQLANCSFYPHAIPPLPHPPPPPPPIIRASFLWILARSGFRFGGKRSSYAMFSDSCEGRVLEGRRCCRGAVGRCRAVVVVKSLQS